jgi:tetratricopeptide (TPR) repeat protein/tRNA A-37 threonylcarbamoyl transferase component Bud32
MTLLGKTIGNFRVIDLIGEGGMGEVYIGYDERLKRKVALKAIRGERRFDEEAKARLLREAEILSKLEHPNICRLYDFIETENADVLVLELIRGESLNKTQLDALSQSEKLEIAIQIGEVLSDAHALSVVHRDLKPENIMIDNRGEVRVLDFGLANTIIDQETASKIWSEIASGDLRSLTTHYERTPGGGFKTDDGIFLGTPTYMSPEQAHCQPTTAASDMYSFGLLLQWLFTGKPPYPSGLSLPELFYRAGTGNTLPPDGVEDDLRRLIERLKSVDPTRRPTALDTVEHLQWILEAPRRRAKKLAVGAIICALTVGIIISGFGLFRAKRSARLERIARDRQEKMYDFLVDMWISPSPMERGRDVKVIDVLAYGKEKVDREFDDDPLIKATLLNHLATTYRRLGEYEKAESIITECLDYCRSTLGPDNSRTINVMVDLGLLLSYNERFQEAETLFRDALSLGEKNLQPDNEILIYAKVNLAEELIRKAEYPEAKELLQESLSAIRGSEELQYKFGPKVLLDLGNILVDEEDFPGAEKVFLELLQDYEEKGDTSNPNYIAAMGSVARVFMEQKKYEEGLRYMREGLELSSRINGERHITTLASTINLGQALSELGKYEESYVYLEGGYRGSREMFGEKSPTTVFISVTYANLLLDLGRIAEAESILNEAVSLNIELLGPEHPNTILSQYVLSLLLFESDRNSEAEALVRNVLDTSVRVLGADMDMTLESKDLLGRILDKKGDHEGAESIHREVLETRINALGSDNPSTANTLLYLAESLYEQGKYEESSQRIEQAVRSNHETLGKDHPSTKESVALLVKVFAASGKTEKATELLESLGLHE